MKAFVRILHPLLGKLEVILQLLEAHGYKDVEPEFLNRGTEDEPHYHITWRWPAGDVSLGVIVRFTAEGGDIAVDLYDTYEDCGFTLRSADGERFYYDSSEHLEGGSAIMRFYWDVLPNTDVEENGHLYMNPARSREILGMVIGFFAKLPVEQPAEATTTP